MTHWMTLDDQPRAVIKPVGRWTYHVAVEHGLCRWGPDGYGWHVLGRRRAGRKAAKALRLYLRDQLRQSETVTIEAGFDASRVTPEGP